MRQNRLREIWGGGGHSINGWLGIPSSYSAEVMAHQGWDSLVVDLQHGVVDYQTAVTMLQAVSTTDVVPMARVPWLEPGIIMKMLDAGCYGIICPMVNTRAEAEAFVGACRYAPDGYRSYGPVRATLYAGADYQANANATVLALAMIETAKALENLDEIVSVPGLDGVYIYGPQGGPVSNRPTAHEIGTHFRESLEGIETPVLLANNMPVTGYEIPIEIFDWFVDRFDQRPTEALRRLWQEGHYIHGSQEVPLWHRSPTRSRRSARAFIFRLASRRVRLVRPTRRGSLPILRSGQPHFRL
ncbi:MAG: hypothetical protein IH961_10865 [Chloroflexi bacterium]|nr:hypothetical protein [Chloroflexota bacterium]